MQKKLTAKSEQRIVYVENYFKEEEMQNFHRKVK